MEKLITKGLLILSLVLTFSLQAQENTVSGTVLDEAGLPLPGASIIIKGSTTGTETDFDGNYTLTAKNSDILVVSFIGYLTQEIAVAGKRTININLVEDANQLDEVVVVGYGTQKKESVTGAASFVKMDEIVGDRPVVNAEQLLQGVAAGLQVVTTNGRPGSTSTFFNIRGTTSINGGGPLVLVNNVPMDLQNVNPQDIESVSVLKDAAASSIYGARAAFGVILITTKQGNKNQPTKFAYSATANFTTPAELPEKATTREFVEFLGDMGAFNFFSGQDVIKWKNFLDIYETDPSQLNLLDNPAGGKYAIHNDLGTLYPLEDTDLIDDFLNDNGFSTIHNLTISGGGEKISYRVNGGYSYEDGIMVTDKDSHKKYILNANLNAPIASNVESSTTIFYTKSNTSSASGSFSSSIQLPMYIPTGSFETDQGIYPVATPGNSARFNTPATSNRSVLRLFERMVYTPVKNLSITGEYTYEEQFNKSMSVNDGNIFANAYFLTASTTPEQAQFNTRISRGTSDVKYNSINLYGKFVHEINNHNFELLGGFNREERVSTSFSANRNDLIDATLPSFQLVTGENFRISDSFGDWSVLGYFSKLNYNYKEKYFLEVSGRYDGSSRFQEGSRFLFVPSFSAGWNLAKESFLEKADFISLLKIRGSWGEIGNQNTSDLYPSILGYESDNPKWINLDSGQRYLTFNPPGLISGGFTWERVRTTNIGLDANFFNNRLTTSSNIYQRETIGMLSAAKPLPKLLGTPAPDQNRSDLKTVGWEVEIGYKNKSQGGWVYGINGNISNNSAEITKFDNPGFLIGSHYVGEKIGDIWGLVTDGYYTVDDFVTGTLDASLSGDNRELKEGVVQIENARTPYPGDIKYKDLNGDGTINNGNSTLFTDLDENGDPITDADGYIHTGTGDRKVIGNSLRKLQFGLNGYVKFKGFDFSFVVNGVGKRDQWIDTDLSFPYRSRFDHIYKHQLDYWTPDNQDAFYPRIYGDPNGNTQSNYSNNRRTQTKYLWDGSYLKIQNLTLGYTIPQSALKKSGINNVRVFVMGSNIYTFDKLPKGMDTDLGFNGVYPLLTNYSLGINLSF